MFDNFGVYRMKVLLINFTDAGGGAAIAAVRLVNALNEHRVYARLGVVDKRTTNPYVFELPRKKHSVMFKIYHKCTGYLEKIFNPFIKRLPHPQKFKTSNGILHTTNFKSETDINWINNSEFDLVNLHWISGVICNKDIAKIKKPIVWTMHDSWPCCGAEHHPNVIENDKRWQEGYYKWNKPKSTKGQDLCRKVWNQKKKYIGNKDIVFAAPSNWEHDILKSSKLFGNSACKVIPNIIDHSVFYPKDKKTARVLFNIPSDKIVIGFGAAYDIDNPKSMKGSYYLIDALKKLKNSEDYYLVIFGSVSDSFTSLIQIPFFASGFISNPNILSAIYSACDVIINPSLIENLPTVCLESICCGIPVVAFDVGGTSDIVVHKETGYLATPYMADELIDGVEWCIKNQKELSNNCLKKAEKDFDSEKIINEYINVYKSVIEEKN